MADFALGLPSAPDETFVPGGQCTITQAPPAPSPTRADILVPKFQPLPDLKCPDWVSADARKMFEELQAEKADLADGQDKLIDKIRKRLSADPSELTTSRPGARQKAEFDLLKKEVAFRERVTDYFETLLDEGADEDRKRSIAVRDTRAETEKQLEAAISVFGINKDIYIDRFHFMVSGSKAVHDAMRHCRVLDAFRDRLKDMNHKRLIQNCRDRMQVLADEIVSMC